MLSPEIVFELLRREGVSFFTGVPDSLLKAFCAYVTDHSPSGSHVVAANEGGAVGLATGHYLATGNPALVYMQNSGIGNAVNPLLSLADSEVYGIPMLLMIGWRGEPGVKDEPQHKKQGRITPALLAAMEIPYFTLDAASDARSVVEQAHATAMSKRTPCAIVVKAGTFAPYALLASGDSDVDTYPLRREEALRLVVNQLGPSDAIVATTGMTSRELFEYRVASGAGHAQDFLTVGAMGHSSQIALGIALSKPDLQVICLDGDGAVLMHAGSLTIIGQQACGNFKHIIFNNGAHDSVGGQPTAGFQADLAGMARASGYSVAVRASEPDEVRAAIRQILLAKGPALLEVRVRKGARSNLGRPTTSPRENRDAFMSQFDQ